MFWPSSRKTGRFFWGHVLDLPRGYRPERADSPGGAEMTGGNGSSLDQTRAGPPSRIELRWP